MNHVERYFSQGDASRLAELPQDVLRDWRRRDFLSGLGEQAENGRWSYSFHEIIELAIVRILAGNGQSIRSLLYMASRLALNVTSRFNDDEFFKSVREAENVAFLFGDDGELSTGILTIKSMDDFEYVYSKNPQAIVVNVSKLTDQIPDGIKLLLGNDA